MNATYFAVPVQIGEQKRSLVCNFRAVDEITKVIGRNPLEGNLFVADSAMIPVVQIAAIMAALLRKEDPGITADALLDEMELWQLPEYMKAIAHVMAGPDFGKEQAQPPANPQIADAP
jgi:hypothetical protein